MAVTTLENLVLGGIRVVAGVKTMLVREGSKQGHVQTSASLSHPRHLSPSWPMTDYQADSRRATRVPSSSASSLCSRVSIRDLLEVEDGRIAVRWSPGEVAGFASRRVVVVRLG